MPAPSLPAAEPGYRIAFKGQDIGEFTLSTIRKMLAGGMLTLQDFYYDSGTNEWTPLEQLKELLGMFLRAPRRHPRLATLTLFAPTHVFGLLDFRRRLFGYTR